ncbi:MAG: GNAT family N-acetyltransferase [Hyphomicrobiales bacterium]|nr:GNAT family N-acetyltransferase [Hyphomicrobiales bacterium]
MRIELKIEHEIDSDQHDQITSLRNKSFPDAPRERSYFKQLPHFRLLAEDNGILAGHLGVDHRIIRVGGTILSIFGVIDLFVSDQHQGKGIATSLLAQITELAEQKGIDFLLLHAVDGRLYLKNGFRVISPYLKSLWLCDFENYGVGIERLDNIIYIKSTSDKAWPDGTVDIMGYLF